MKVASIENSKFSPLKEKYFPDCDLHPLHSTLSKKYYTEYFSGNYKIKFQDVSFIVFDEIQAYCIVGLTISTDINGFFALDYYGMPSYYKEYEDIPFSHNKKIDKCIKKHIQNLFNKFDFKKIRYVNNDNLLSVLPLFFLKNSCSQSIYLTQVINLGNPIEDIKYGLRKGHKAAINWLYKNINTKIIFSKNIKKSDINEFRKLHIKASGRETRTKKTWDVQYDMIKNNEAFIVIGERDGSLIAAALFQYSNDTCFYSVSASNRNMFNKPVSHILIWEAIIYAKKIKCKNFELGEQIYDYKNKENEFNISSFKRGFGGQTIARILISNG